MVIRRLIMTIRHESLDTTQARHPALVDIAFGDLTVTAQNEMLFPTLDRAIKHQAVIHGRRHRLPGRLGIQRQTHHDRIRRRVSHHLHMHETSGEAPPNRTDIGEDLVKQHAGGVRVRIALHPHRFKARNRAQTGIERRNAGRSSKIIPHGMGGGVFADV